MIAMKRILLGLGGTPLTGTAIRRAVDLAKRHEGSITGVTVLDQDRLARLGAVPLGAGHGAKMLLAQRRAVTSASISRAVAELRSQCDQAGIPHHVLREAGNPFTILTAESRLHDLSIFSLRSLFDYGVVDDPDDVLYRLLLRGVGPVLGIGPRSAPVQRVLVGWNGSPSAARALKHLILLRPWPDARIRLLSFHDARSEAPAEFCLDRAAELCTDHGLSVEVEERAGSPHRALLPLAEEWGADALVLGCSGRNLLLRKVVPDLTLRAIKGWNRSLFLSA